VAVKAVSWDWTRGTVAIKDLLQFGSDVITEIDQWQAKRQDIISRLYDTAGPPPVVRNTRAIEVLCEEKLPGYVRCRVRYVVGEDDPVSAYLLVPHTVEQPAPAIVAMHQTVNSGKDEVVGLAGCPDFAYGHELASRGYVILAPDYLTAGERIYALEEAFESGPFYEQYPDWSMVGKNVEDSMSAVDVLCGLTYVDEERIGAIGHSHGGHNVIFAMALDERIKAGVSNCGMSVFSEEEERLEWSLEDGYIYIPALREYFLRDKEAPFDINEVAALIAPRPWLNISSYYDAVYGHQEFLAQVGVQMYQLYELYGRQSAFSYFMHGNDHSFPQFARNLAYSWLDRFLL
jgi:dienelactone hydrolase